MASKFATGKSSAILINVGRRAAAPTAFFCCGFGTYAIKEREETVGQLIPLGYANAYSKVASNLRFLRRSAEDLDQTPEIIELRTCTSILQKSKDMGIDSDSLRKLILKKAVDATCDAEIGSLERLSVLTFVIEDMENWNGESLLDAVRSLDVLPPSAEACNLARKLKDESNQLMSQAQKAKLWTRNVYGPEAEVPENTQYPEYEEIEEAFKQFWSKQSVATSIDGGRIAAVILEYLSDWRVLIPLILVSGGGVFYILGQDVLGVAQYRASDVPREMRKHALEIKDNVSVRVQELHLEERWNQLEFSDSVNNSVRLVRERLNNLNLAAPNMNEVRPHLTRCRRSFENLAAMAGVKIDHFMERLRERLGSQTDLPPPQMGNPGPM